MQLHRPFNSICDCDITGLSTVSTSCKYDMLEIILSVTTRQLNIHCSCSVQGRLLKCQPHTRDTGRHGVQVSISCCMPQLGLKDDQRYWGVRSTIGGNTSKEKLAQEVF